MSTARFETVQILGKKFRLLMTIIQRLSGCFLLELATINKPRHLSYQETEPQPNRFVLRAILALELQF